MMRAPHRTVRGWSRARLTVTRLLMASVVLLSVSATTLEAQRSGGRSRGRGRAQPEFLPNVPYDGRFTYARIRYELPEFTFDIKWSHDYPRGERHFTKVMTELSTIRTHTTGSNILTLDDPELTKYPVAFLTEPGFWRPSEAEVVGMRNYVMKGGFMVFDDFAGEHWDNFEQQLRRVFPQLRPIPLTLDHPVFDSFYRIKSIDLWHPYYGGMKATFFGVFEDNDPKKRLLAIANYNFDMSEFWEFSDEGMFPIEASNEAYKIGVNYIIYALTR